MEKIDLKVAQEMVARYATTRKALIDKTYGIDDTRSTWIGIDELKSYVSQLPTDATGVRIYLGVHDATDTQSPNQTSVVIVGTVGANDSDVIVDNAVALKYAGALDPFNKTKDCPPICIPPTTSI